MTRIAAALLLLAAGSGVVGTGAHAQGVRGTAVTNLRYLSLRPMSLDTVPWANVVETESGFSYQGDPVFCEGANRDCVRYVTADVAHGVIATQDVSATAWGLGLQGLSATFLLRGRADLDGDFVWPTARDDFDAILAYAQLQRPGYRIRAGRQRTFSGLGFAGFDGVDVVVSPWEWLRAELYGGRSLARGLAEPRHEALRGIEDFVQDQDAYLYGGFIEWAPGPVTSLGIRYQREIWADGIGLVSERASADLRSDLIGPLRMDASADYDFAFDRVGKAHLTLRSRLPWGWVELTGRRYVPYFELSTIWGFFSPTPYHEAEVEATLLRFRPLTVWASVAYREYGDPEISVIGPPISDASQRYGLGARWQGDAWLVAGEYVLETGFGAHLSSGDLSLRWAPTDAWSVRVRGSAVQQIEQFRVGDNTVLGAGVGGTMALPWGVQLQGGADLYRQAWENRAGQTDWNQVRAYTVLVIPFGEDPGMKGRR